jgi:N6-L-threonylcarbamoyladenine synthase
VLILGIESTCDESSAAVIEAPRRLLSNIIKSQIDEHRRFGGVVPEIASRLHLNILAATVEEALAQAKVSIQDIDLIAVANRPGLVGGLLVGSTIAKTLAYLLNKPLVVVDHLMGHLLASDLEDPLNFPCIGGIFSGGHSNIYLGRGENQWQMLVRSRDDAPGESYDKTAKLMGLPYPGGPSIQRFAEGANEKLVTLPLPIPKSLNGDFSFSGLKTSVLYHIRGTNGQTAVPPEQWPDLAAAFQFTVAKALSLRMVECAIEHDVKHIYVGGGVAANKRLREVLLDMARPKGIAVQFPSISLCMDNAAMIARAGYVLYEAGEMADLNVDVSSRSELGLVASK